MDSKPTKPKQATLKRSEGQDRHSGKSDQTASAVPVYCAHAEMRSVEKLIPHPRNPNRHPPEQLRLLAKVIRGNGWRSPIVVSKRSGYVIKGHGRREAAILAGLTEAPVDVQDYASEAEEMADLVADNRLSELAEMDSVSLKDLLQDMDSGEIDMELAGFTDIELERLMTQWHVAGENDAGAEWQGMPECASQDLTAWKSVRVNFNSPESMKAFAEIVGQTVTENTRSLWYPAAEIGRYADKRYTG